MSKVTGSSHAAIGSHGKISGAGVGLRAQHLPVFLAERPDVPWFELLIDNFLFVEDEQLAAIDELCDAYPVTFHSVGFNLGSVDPLDPDYLARYVDRMQRWRPQMLSDHLCWTGAHGHNQHDLLPLPYTAGTAQHVAERIQQIQDRLGHQILVENISAYLRADSLDGQVTMPEAEFIAEVCRLSGCGVLLDINNLYCNGQNLAEDTSAYLDVMADLPVQQYHLAGYEPMHGVLVDTHGAAITDPVWQLTATVMQRCGRHPLLIERDNNLPSWPEFVLEQQRAAEYYHD